MRLVRRLRRWLPGLPFPDPPLSRDWPSRQAWERRDADEREQVNAQYRLQCEVVQACGDDGWPGWCGLCRAPVLFRLSARAKRSPDELRDDLACPTCLMTARARTALALLCDGLALDTARIYLTEQASRAFLWLQHASPAAQGSEFGLDARRRRRLQAWFARRGGRGTLVEQDATRLAFADASLDAIGSFDVLEHIPDYASALREFARCLRPGGRLVLTVPFVESAATTLVRARRTADGGVEHLLPEEMHGDPAAGRVLCWYHFGWDLADTVRDAGFRRAAWVRTWSPREGAFGLWTLVATR